MLQHAEIIAIGSELLTPSRLDTNSLFLTERLNSIGRTIWNGGGVPFANAVGQAGCWGRISRLPLLLIRLVRLSFAPPR